MSTRCLIGYVNKETNAVRYIYIHCDGYPSHIAPILKGTYNTYEKMIDLVSRGSARNLAETYEDMEFYRDWDKEDYFGYPFVCKDENTFFNKEEVDYGAAFKYLLVEDGCWVMQCTFCDIIELY